MPTYLNPTQHEIVIKEVGLILKPGENHSLLVVPEILIQGKYKKYNIEITSIFPCYNPIISDTLVLLEEEHDITEVPINIFETDYVEISDATTNCNIFIQDIRNQPPIRLYIGDSYTLRVKNRVSKLIIDPHKQGQVWIRQLTDQIDYERWQKGGYSINSIADNLDVDQQGANFK